MTQIIKWLEAQGVGYSVNPHSITIMLEKDCVWINGFGEPMKWDRKIVIYKNPYKEYRAYEMVGYNMSEQLCWTSKQSKVIEALQKRLRKEE